MREYDLPSVSRTLGPMFRHHAPARHEGGLVHQIVVIIGISVLSGALIAGLAGSENRAGIQNSSGRRLSSVWQALWAFCLLCVSVSSAVV